MTELINILGNKLKPTKYQKRVIDKMEKKNSILLTMPTNSGKTTCAYKYAELDTNYFENVIFTAPIKALSNERYSELIKQEMPVDLITGDVRTDNKNPIICCTQEIYNNELYKRKAIVVIDEFHYIFNNPDRARSYIESIEKTNKESKLLLMSATIDQPNLLCNWLSNLTGRNFESVSSNERLVPLEYDLKGIKCKDVHNAIIFCFSLKDIRKVIEKICSYRKKINKKKIEEIEQLSIKYNIEFMSEWEYGISGYSGKLLPKEKDFIVYLYRNNYIDTVVGTDSLALGVNLPAKYVIIADIYRRGNEKLKPSEFQQLTGRAGRYGQFDIGIGTFLLDSPLTYVDGMKYDLKNEFKNFTKRKLEKTKINSDIDYKSLINGKYLEEESNDLIKYSYPFNDTDYAYKNKYKYVSENMSKISELIENYSYLCSGDTFSQLFMKYYLQEWDIETNCYNTMISTKMLDNNGSINVSNLINSYKLKFKQPGVFIYELLLLNKWLKAIRLDDYYRISDYNKLIDTVNTMDNTIFHPELRIC